MSSKPTNRYFDGEIGAPWQELLPNGVRNVGDVDASSCTPLDDQSPTSINPPSLGSKDENSMVRYQQTKIIPGRIRKRVVLKNGVVNLSKAHLSKRSQRYLQDIFTTLVDIKWRWNLLVFAMGFILSWLSFALIWWLICMAHGDLDPVDDNWKPCVESLNSFTSAFLFSVETQHTIGYGSRYTTEECPEAIFIMAIQSVTGVMIQCFMAGIVFAKLSRPKKRSQTLMFSRYATICLRDGKLCLTFRVGDMRKSHIIGATVSAQLIRRKTTAEGEIIPYYQTSLDLKFDEGADRVFLIWPATIVHQIDSNSPFYALSAEDMLRERYEIVVILEGTIESTGQSIQARSSYLPNEILWGHRFEQVVSFRKETGEYLVDYSKFNSTQEVETPLCSAKMCYEYQRMVNDIPRILQSPSSARPIRRCLSNIEQHQRGITLDGEEPFIDEC
ncbi:G protein-activated inward rectifier potassium channel 3-like [Centruroides sculpturatus]|uniref:G protein-activated inward rectifier potassium channel 3-like n=1 Tax=Centruroides sculpturatus TaxID=218467 RepID=UPI000C6CA8BF|nr:G protein-activated inward rectifier potassium channel 3-like [Centruroides sculpturatus]XP_023228632.1 G protein-activated inward rectifier potassium channel 3-like [Centruroides sculpturatus]